MLNSAEHAQLSWAWKKFKKESAWGIKMSSDKKTNKKKQLDRL